MLRNYLLTAWKVFMRRKLFTAINLACIVLTLVVLMVITALLEMTFYPTGVEGKSPRFVQIYTMRSMSADHTAIRSGPLGFKTIDKYLKPMQGVERVSAFTLPDAVSIYQGDRVSELQLRRVDADYWKILDFKVLAGRLPNADDDTSGRLVAVINASSARKLFGGSPAQAVDQTISAGGQPFRVIGVVEDVMHINSYADMWAPLSTFPSSDYQNQLNGNFAAMLLAKDAADIPRIQQEVARIARSYVAEDPKTYASTTFWANCKIDLVARTLLGGDVNGDAGPDSGARRLLAYIAGGMFVFMLLPALNLVNLNMGRILERSAEIGVRKAFGATSLHLVGQLVVENVLLCLAGGLLGLAATQGVLWWLEQSQLIPYLKVDVNLPVFGCGMLLSFIFGLLSGVIPAWKMSRLDPVHALKGAA